MKQYLDLLGKKATDKVTGFKGTITSIAFDLFGCIQALIDKGIDKDGKFGEERVWLDVNRLKISDQKRVMPIPDYEKGYQAEGKQGAADKPAFKTRG